MKRRWKAGDKERPVFQGIDHVVIAVKDFEGAIAQYEGLYGVRAERGSAPGMKTAHFRLPDSYLELVTSDGDQGPVAKRLAEGNEGVYLVAVRTDDMTETLAELRQKEVRLIGDPGPDNPVGGQVFIHPASAAGVLTQIVEQ